MSDSEQGFVKYVLAFAERDESEILTILKDKPSWQKGRINLAGGKVESGESPEDAVRREVLEETGLVVRGNPKLMGLIQFEGGEIHVFSLHVDGSCSLVKEAGNDEIPAWSYWYSLLEDPRLLPNLRLIIPLCFFGVTGWTIRETSFNDDSCKMEVIL